MKRLSFGWETRSSSELLPSEYKVVPPPVMWTLVYKSHEYYRYNPHSSTLVK